MIKRREVAKEEVGKLLKVGNICEFQYLERLENSVLVKKANGKWRMYVDFTVSIRLVQKIAIPYTQSIC